MQLNLEKGLQCPARQNIETIDQSIRQSEMQVIQNILNFLKIHFFTDNCDNGGSANIFHFGKITFGTKRYVFHCPT